MPFFFFEAISDREWDVPWKTLDIVTSLRCHLREALMKVKAFARCVCVPSLDLILFDGRNEETNLKIHLFDPINDNFAKKATAFVLFWGFQLSSEDDFAFKTTTPNLICMRAAGHLDANSSIYKILIQQLAGVTTSLAVLVFISYCYLGFMAFSFNCKSPDWCRFILSSWGKELSLFS